MIAISNFTSNPLNLPHRCPFLHRTAGDTERRYHLRYYKTGMCVHDTDVRGYCVKNGPHCAFAHGVEDVRYVLLKFPSEVNFQVKIILLVSSNNPWKCKKLTRALDEQVFTNSYMYQIPA